MLELTGLDTIFRAAGVIYVLVGLACTLLVLRTVRGKAVKIVVALLVIGGFIYYPAKSENERKAQERAWLESKKKAYARYKELCKTSGEFIHRTAVDVDGVFLIKLRPGVRSQRNDAVDPFGFDFDGQGKPFGNGAYIQSFLRVRDEKGKLVEALEGMTPGYQYVDLVSPEDGKRYRYRGAFGIAPELVGTPLGVHPELYLTRELSPEDSPLPRYGVTYDDITLPADRQMWIAGSSLKVIDLKTGEVMGERIGYMIDPLQGNTGAARSVWDWARGFGPACPRTNFIMQTRNFVEKILKVRGK